MCHGVAEFGMFSWEFGLLFLLVLGDFKSNVALECAKCQ